MSKLNTIQNGKGSKPRPIKDLEKFNDNWDEIFSKKTEKVLDLPKEKSDNPETYEKSNSHSS